MANLTITVNDEALRRARMRAIEQGTSVNALLSAYLEAYSRTEAARDSAIRELLDRSAGATSGRGGRRWSREELHER